MAAPIHGHLRIFVATTAERVPPDAHPFVSVDGAVPGAAIVWDHHRTGELVNLDAMPSEIDARAYRGVGTTLADTDAAVSAAVVLLGGAAHVRRDAYEVLLAAAHRCDHLVAHPAVDAEIERRGDRLHAWVSRELERASDVSAAFATVSRTIADRLCADEPLPEAEPRADIHAARARALLDDGRIDCRGHVALVDLRGVAPIEPRAVYGMHRCPIAVTLGTHERGGHRYTVGVNPFVADHPRDLRPALAALAREEHRLGPPCVSPVPGDETAWGGRATVFGSPWNYGSRIAPDDVVRIVALAIFGERDVQ